MSVRLHFHGAAGSVTGACFRLETDRASVLVDCGLFQGPKTLKELNYQPFPFDPKAIGAVLLTHAHVDHSGLLPKLMLKGFSGPVYATAGTRDLSAVMLPDAGGIQEHEVEQLNRRFQHRGRDVVEPIYTAADARDCLRLFSKVKYGELTPVAPGISARWWDAGHILGAASIEVEIDDGARPLRLLFSGDIGPGGSDFVGDPQGPSGVDHLVMECTYGKTERPRITGEDRRRSLAEEVKAAHAAGGPLVIPAFAVERTQELITDLIALMDEGAAPPAPIFLDSPLAIKATDVFFQRGYNISRGENPFAGMRGSTLFHPTESADESQALERLTGWHVIIAASGMCDAGRIRHHLKRVLWRKDATVMLVGYQATGTLGRFLQEGAHRVRVQGEEIRVRARIRSLDVYSGHADGPGLVAWAKARGPVAGKLFLAHGEPDSRKAMERRLAEAGFDASSIICPELDDAFTLEETASAPIEIEARRLPAGAAAELDWHNTRSQLLLALDEALEEAQDDRARQGILERLLALLPRGARPR